MTEFPLSEYLRARQIQQQNEVGGAEAGAKTWTSFLSNAMNAYLEEKKQSIKWEHELNKARKTIDYQTQKDIEKAALKFAAEFPSEGALKHIGRGEQLYAPAQEAIPGIPAIPATPEIPAQYQYYPLGSPQATSPLSGFETTPAIPAVEAKSAIPETPRIEPRPYTAAETLAQTQPGGVYERGAEWKKPELSGGEVPEGYTLFGGKLVPKRTGAIGTEKPWAEVRILLSNTAQSAAKWKAAMTDPDETPENIELYKQEYYADKDVTERRIKDLLPAYKPTGWEIKETESQAKLLGISLPWKKTDKAVQEKGLAAGTTSSPAVEKIAPNMIKVKNPDGTIGQIPRNQLKDALKQGYIVVK